MDGKPGKPGKMSIFDQNQGNTGKVREKVWKSENSGEIFKNGCLLVFW